MFDPKEEQQFAELKKLARKLHVPIPEVFLELEVFDKDGKLIQRHRQRSHSWVRNAYNHMFSQLAAKDDDDDTFGAGKLSIKDILAVVKHGNYPITFREDLSLDAENSGYLGSAGADTQGIVVGSGTDEIDPFEYYALQTKIVNGTGAGELNYVASEATAITYADTTLTATLVRYFNNNTVGETSVDVNEVGLDVWGHAQGAAQIVYLQARDVLASTVTVPSTGQLKVTYTIQLTYPA